MDIRWPERIPLARTPTPIERLDRIGRDENVEIWVKRDDLTGVALSGNKVRKLEFLLREALDRGARTVITCGGVQSNHARATAVAAARLGLRREWFQTHPRRPGDRYGNLYDLTPRRRERALRLGARFVPSREQVLAAREARRAVS